MDIIVKPQGKKIKKIGIAFGGGGARGFAHLGVVKAFEELGIHFDYIAGTSIGAIVGALYAYGMSSEDMIKRALKIRIKDLKTNTIPFMPSKTDAMQDLLKSLLGDICFSDLKTPFCACAVDIRTGKEVHITKGKLIPAICGSSAVPAIFNPVECGDYLLFDGGLQNTIPSNIPKMNGCDAVIGVDINSTRGQGTNSKKYIDLMMASISIMMKSNAIKGYLNTDIMIKPDMQAFSSSKIINPLDMIQQGYDATMAVKDEILELFHKRKKRNIFSRLFSRRK